MIIASPALTEGGTAVRVRRLTLCGTLAALLGLALAARADNWPAWRGADGQGQCKEKDLPLFWSQSDNVKWKVKLPDHGNSTPVVWGDHIFLTQATEKGHKRSLMCLSRKDGKELWTKTVEYKDEDPTHNTNPYCASSPATDGERVVAWHGSAGLFCYDFKGELLWERDLGKCRHIWGYGSSPLLYGDLVILNFGPGERTFLVALDKKDGKEVWKVEEPGGKEGKPGETWIGSWSTPVVVGVEGRDELIVSWPGVVKAFDPKSGELLWSCKGLEKDAAKDRLVYTSPLATPEVVVCMAGFTGPYLAVKPGGKGDVTESRRLWRETKAPQRIGSGVLVGDHVYIVNDSGTAQCIEWKTGKTVFNERVGTSAWGSLVHSDGRLYVTNQEGETVVFEAKPTFKLLARNPLKETTRASIAVSEGQLFIRTDEHLWCIGK
jgi:outer membrane protein assembly factor BamB